MMPGIVINWFQLIKALIDCFLHITALRGRSHHQCHCRPHPLPTLLIVLQMDHLDSLVEIQAIKTQMCHTHTPFGSNMSEPSSTGGKRCIMYSGTLMETLMSTLSSQGRMTSRLS